VDQWSAVHRAFAVKGLFFFSKRTTVTATQRIFRRHFNKGRQNGSLSHHEQELGTDVRNHGLCNK